MHHGRHEVDPLHALLVDQPQRLLGIKLDHAGDAAAAEQREVREDKRRVVIERPGIEQRGVERNSELRFGGCVDDSGVVVKDHLGPSGRPTAGHRLPVPRDRIGHWFVGKTIRHEIRRQAVRRIPIGLAADHQRGPQYLQHGGGLATRQPPRQRGWRSAALPYRKGRFVERIAVRQPDRDEIAGLDAVRGEGACAPVGVALELLPGDGVVAVAYGDRVFRLAPGIPARHVGEGEEHGRFQGVLLTRL
jgi:hypothetical protein